MPNYMLIIGLVVAMLALLATSTDEAALNDDIETQEDAETLNNLLLGNLLQSRVDRSWRKPCQDNSCFQSGRGWKRSNFRGSPFSMDGFKCVGDGCDRGWKRTSQRKR